MPHSPIYLCTLVFKTSHICPSDELHGILRWYIEVGSSREGPVLEVSTSGTEDKKEAVSEIQAKMAAVEAKMAEQMQGIKNTVDDMNAVLRSLEQSLTSQK